MLTQTIRRVDLTAFTHRLIDLNIHQDIALYRQLCHAYDALLSGHSEAGYGHLVGRVAMPAQPTLQTLNTAIDTLIMAHKG